LIHGSSSDPVLIKKIYLKIWALRDEVEAVLSKVIKNNGGSKEGIDLEAVKNEYLNNGEVSAGGLSVIEGGAGDDEEEDLEAAMAAALVAPDEGAAEEEEEEEEEEEDDAAAAAAMLNGQGDEGGDAAAAAAAMLDGQGDDEEPTQVSSPTPASYLAENKIIQRKSSLLHKDKVSSGMSILSELGMDTIYFFCKKPFLEGQSIVIEFQVPLKFVVNAQIVYCRPYNLRSRVISQNKLTYRVSADFSFLKPGERTVLRQFIASIEPDVPDVEEVAAGEAATGGGGGDDFDELDNLDF
jgi:hypothetical protein